MFPDALHWSSSRPITPTDIVAAAQQKRLSTAGDQPPYRAWTRDPRQLSARRLRDPDTTLEQKNAALLAWMQTKLANRQVRYYAEATYQFDE